MVSNKAYDYCKVSVKKKTTPKYVKLQMRDFMRVCEGKDKNTSSVKRKLPKLKTSSRF